MEVLSGADGDDALLRDFLDQHFQIIPLDLAIADEALQPRREFRLCLPDTIIWGQGATTILGWSHVIRGISTLNGKEFIYLLRFNNIIR